VLANFAVLAHSHIGHFGRKRGHPHCKVRNART
jgi:hypothetical protein